MSTPFDAVPQAQQGYAPQTYAPPAQQGFQQVPPAQAHGMDQQQFAAFQAWQAQQAAATQAAQYAAPPAPAQPQGPGAGGYSYPGQHAPQQPQQPPAQALPVGTLDDFYNQPQSANGKSLAFDEIGDGYIVRVARAVTNGDVRAQTDDAGNPTYFRDGRAKLVLVLPVQIYQHGTAQKPMGPLPEGVTDASWWVKGKDWAALQASMAASGCTSQLPEEGAFIKVVHTKKQKNRPPMADTKIKDVQYIRPEGADAATEATNPQALDAANGVPVNTVAASTVAPAPAPAPAQLAIDTPPPAAPVQPPAAPADVQAPAMDLSPEMAAKLQALTGGK